MKKFPRQPYLGLGYYEYENTRMFAGRERESMECAQLIWDKNVVLLHGRTGCGKSSFLRAGVRPVLADGKLGIGFSDREGKGFDVVRSGRRPLRRLHARIREIIDSIDVDSGTCDIGAIRGGAEGAEQLLNMFDAAYLQSLDESMPTSAQVAYDAVARLSRAMEKKPIFVIDQAEEVFSLTERQSRQADPEGESISGPQPGEPASQEELDDEQAAYFEFIRELGDRKGARLVLSMRTEYKGLFDDRLAGGSGEGRRGVEGFFLSELEGDGLLQAIRRPTLDQEEWEALGYDGPCPRDTYKFTFGDGVPEEIAAQLQDVEAIPSGGVLPTLQITCFRLWRAGRRSRRRAAGIEGELFRISKAQMRQMGKVQHQIREFVSEAVETECSRPSLRWNQNISRVSDAVLRGLSNSLATNQADGRAVTAVVRREDLVGSIAMGTSWTDSEIRNVGKVLDRLMHHNWGVLKKEAPGPNMPDRNDMITLGHDSVALVLNNWRLVNGTSEAMMRMSMGRAKAHSDFDMTDLFPGAVVEKDGSASAPQLQKVRIEVPRDFSWDHQIVEFAMNGVNDGFAKRLGIEFEFPDELDGTGAKSDPKSEVKRPGDWAALRAELMRRDVESRRSDGDPDQGQAGPSIWRDRKYMIPSEWSLFPGMNDDPDNGFIRRDHIQNWSDVAVTNVSLSVGLIGPWSEKLDRLQVDLERQRRAGSSSLDSEAFLQGHEELIRMSLSEMMDGGRVRTYGRNGQRFLRLAASLVGMEQDVLKFMRGSRKKERNFVAERGREFAGKTLITSWLLGENEETERRYAVGGAFSRALAEQAGFQVKFGAHHVLAIGRDEMAIRSRNGGREHLKGVKDIAYELQHALTHTTWQLSMRSAQWNQGVNRAVVLRLAAVAYYTVEYARTHMKEFVLHLYSYVNRLLQPSGDDSAQEAEAVRLSRSAIESTLGDCFDFNRFDEIGPAYFDLDSPVAYVTGHLALGSRSIFGEVYEELVRLRQSTITHYAKIERSVSWLKAHDCFDPTAPELVEASRIKEFAWNHFKIFNFYDAERFMQRAAIAYENHTETTNADLSGNGRE